MLLEVNSGTLPENATDVITKCDSYYAKVYYKMKCVKFFITKYELLQTATFLLQIAADITKWDDIFHNATAVKKSMILLQNVTVITNCIGTIANSNIFNTISL